MLFRSVQHQMAECRLLGPLRHALDGEQVVKNMVDHRVGILPVIVGVHPVSPLDRRPRTSVRSRLDSFHHHSHRICSARPGEVGNSTGRVRRDPRGRVPGVSTDSTPGGALRPGSQAGLRRLIVSRTGSVLAALPKAAPRRWHSRSPKGTIAPCGSLRALWDARLSGWLPVLLVFD